ncbi:MAG: response regulator [Alphaproteobacteria bacterium]|nr:response regulator [Alphaproteobacteria bacterium]
MLETQQPPSAEPVGLEQSYALVALVDDDDRARRSLAEDLRRYRFEVVQFGSLAALTAWLSPDAEAVILAETHSRGLDGQALMTALDRAGCRQPVVGISAGESVKSVVALMKRGVVDFIQKPCATGPLLEALRRAHACLAGANSSGGATPLQRLGKLTPREAEVFACLVEGFATKAIAARLGISTRTAEIHRANVFTKTGARSIAELVRLHVARDDARNGTGRASAAG